MPTCAKCPAELDPDVTGYEPLADGSVLCSDCFYEAMGDEIDRQPITTPQTSR